MFTLIVNRSFLFPLRTGGYINGQRTDAQDKATFDVTNPPPADWIT